MTDVDPLTPDADQARRWVEQELSDPAYAQAEPTPVDRIARAIGEAIGRLFQGGSGDGWGSTLAIVAVVVLVAVIVVALLVWGRPRLPHRYAEGPDTLFGATEGPDAAALRRDAEAHADAGRWEAAIADRMRALARSLADRGAVETPPGATVHGFARRAGEVFPVAAVRLEEAASAFDDVRYLRRPGTAAAYRLVRTLDEDLALATVATAEPR
ncbi:MAG: DUF4129 domain-containing protein [Microbacterium sp.]|uniref:DUF4129 domain-containing protein n=1 Tax=Microbacterium sp. TaxID=51671 RepID=UPI0026283F1D|nr:DUF4129 domain-containing protein [Microbacterium sp.]MCX6501878.1 DUF4129 domain-containing protein [Microbacterium sp.]